MINHLPSGDFHLLSIFSLEDLSVSHGLVRSGADFPAFRPYAHPDRPPITRLWMELEDNV